MGFGRPAHLRQAGPPIAGRRAAAGSSHVQRDIRQGRDAEHGDGQQGDQVLGTAAAAPGGAIWPERWVDPGGCLVTSGSRNGPDGQEQVPPRLWARGPGALHCMDGQR